MKLSQYAGRRRVIDLELLDLACMAGLGWSSAILRRLVWD